MVVTPGSNEGGGVSIARPITEPVSPSSSPLLLFPSCTSTVEAAFTTGAGALTILGCCMIDCLVCCSCSLMCIDRVSSEELRRFGILENSPEARDLDGLTLASSAIT